MRELKFRTWDTQKEKYKTKVFEINENEIEEMM